MTISHTCLRTPPALHNVVVQWYEAALAPLGYKRAASFLDGLVVGFADSESGEADWWVSSADASAPGSQPSSEGEEETTVARILKTHTAFVAKDRAAVAAFHKAAIQAGGKCNGPPGLREKYGPSYYAAFVLDPAGNNIEAVCFAKE
ncbi:hypothetical protein VTJ83DRAFT_2872 [Remersonia thermophila]|uniref:Glyoxalase/fosfomycin resistance/dioxygenase domain-containing protein n=1 Tax=Remersonia thermophila TaxID=72144 RepID=A0ABR4DDW5_9PEZI